MQLVQQFLPKDVILVWNAPETAKMKRFLRKDLFKLMEGITIVNNTVKMHFWNAQSIVFSITPCQKSSLSLKFSLYCHFRFTFGIRQKIIFQSAGWQE